MLTGSEINSESKLSADERAAANIRRMTESAVVEGTPSASTVGEMCSGGSGIEPLPNDRPNLNEGPSADPVADCTSSPGLNDVRAVDAALAREAMMDVLDRGEMTDEHESAIDRDPSAAMKALLDDYDTKKISGLIKDPIDYFKLKETKSIKRLEEISGTTEIAPIRQQIRDDIHVDSIIAPSLPVSAKKPIKTVKRTNDEAHYARQREAVAATPAGEALQSAGLGFLLGGISGPPIMVECCGKEGMMGSKCPTCCMYLFP